MKKNSGPILPSLPRNPNAKARWSCIVHCKAPMVERRSADEGKVPGTESKASRRVLVSLDLENLGTLAEFSCVDGRGSGDRNQ